MMLSMPTRLEDPDDHRLDDYRELRDVAARRRIEGDEFFIAEGPVAIERLLASPHRVRSILLSEQRYSQMAELLSGWPHVAVYTVDRSLLTEIAGFDLHRGAIASANRRPSVTIPELAAMSRRVAVLEGLNDPENLGLIARSARALGVDGLILDPTCIDPYTRRTVRVSMGEILHLPTARASAWPSDAFGVLRDAGFEIWAMTPGPDAVDIWHLPVPDRIAVCFGAEGPGLQIATMGAADRRVAIPIQPDVDSLNVASAAAATFAILTRPDPNSQR